MKVKIGDVCIVKQCPCHKLGPHAAFVIGQEITILSVDAHDPNGLTYETDIPAPGTGWAHWWARECYLTLKRPPAQKVGNWDSCVWRPSPETVIGGQ